MSLLTGNIRIALLCFDLVEAAGKYGLFIAERHSMFFWSS